MKKDLLKKEWEKHKASKNKTRRRSN